LCYSKTIQVLTLYKELSDNLLRNIKRLKCYMIKISTNDTNNGWSRKSCTNFKGLNSQILKKIQTHA